MVRSSKFWMKIRSQKVAWYSRIYGTFSHSRTKYKSNLLGSQLLTFERNPMRPCPFTFEHYCTCTYQISTSYVVQVNMWTSEYITTLWNSRKREDARAWSTCNLMPIQLYTTIQPIQETDVKFPMCYKSFWATTSGPMKNMSMDLWAISQKMQGVKMYCDFYVPNHNNW